MTRLLALDASSASCSVALWVDGEVTGNIEHAPRGHTRRLMPMIDALLERTGVERASLEAIAYGHGPGSFTGIRIAAGVAQGLAFGLGRPLLGISTLRALALGAWRHDGAELVMPALDARLGELYTALYRIEEGVPLALLEDIVLKPERFELPQGLPGTVALVGSGASLIEQLPVGVRENLNCVIGEREPDAADMVRLAAMDLAAGISTLPHEAVPVYLRDQVVSRH